MSLLCLHPDAVIITGVEDDPGGIGIRVFIGQRGRGAYFLISDPDDVGRVRDAWARSYAGHLFALYGDLVQVGVRLNEDGSPSLELVAA